MPRWPLSWICTSSCLESHLSGFRLPLWEAQAVGDPEAHSRLAALVTSDSGGAALQARAASCRLRAGLAVTGAGADPSVWLETPARAQHSCLGASMPRRVCSHSRIRGDPAPRPPLSERMGRSFLGGRNLGARRPPAPISSVPGGPSPLALPCSWQMPPN